MLEDILLKSLRQKNTLLIVSSDFNHVGKKLYDNPCHGCFNKDGSAKNLEDYVKEDLDLRLIKSIETFDNEVFSKAT